MDPSKSEKQELDYHNDEKEICIINYLDEIIEKKVGSDSFNTEHDATDGTSTCSIISPPAPSLQRQDHYVIGPGAYAIRRVRGNENNDDIENEEKVDDNESVYSQPVHVPNEHNNHHQSDEYMVHAVLVEQPNLTRIGSESQTINETVIVAKAKPIFDENDDEDHKAELAKLRNRVFVQRRYTFVYVAILVVAILVTILATLLIENESEESGYSKHPTPSPLEESESELSALEDSLDAIVKSVNGTVHAKNGTDDFL